MRPSRNVGKAKAAHIAARGLDAGDPSAQLRTASALPDAGRLGHGRCRHRWYHTTVEKTTLYLPEDLKSAVKRAAAERGVPEAEIIRESIRVSVGVRPRARGALYSSGQPIARDAEEMLAGFGER
jgi:hypothetical protein